MDVYKKVMGRVYFYLCIIFYFGIDDKYRLFINIFLNEEIVYYFFMQRDDYLS